MNKEIKELQEVSDEKFDNIITKIKGTTEKGLTCQLNEFKKEINTVRDEGINLQREFINRMKKNGEEMYKFKIQKESILKDIERDKEINKESISLFNELNRKMNVAEENNIANQNMLNVYINNLNKCRILILKLKI